jgi:DNA-nicking Smr family endonuclease
MMAGRAPRLTEADREAWTGYTKLITPLAGSAPKSGRAAAPVAGAPFVGNAAPSIASGNNAPPAGNTRLAVSEAAPPPAWHPSPLRAAILARPAAAGVGLTVGGPPAGVDKATWQRFRTGKLASVRKLDLHGMTAQRAFQALTGFLRSAHADGARCVEVVTGRGSPSGNASGNASGNGGGTGVIRREFPLWLNRPDIRPLVLGAAHPHAANTGAVRLLLRRIR